MNGFRWIRWTHCSSVSPFGQSYCHNCPIQLSPLSSGAIFKVHVGCHEGGQALLRMPSDHIDKNEVMVLSPG
jgi:hypothetical protein